MVQLVRSPAASVPVDTTPVLAVHGHFYQPAREDPFTGTMPSDPSAAPARDWNDRIAQEAYAPNAALGNFGRIGWDLGPTVARWLREHRRSLHDEIMAQAAPEAIMAQGYHHAILPLVANGYQDARAWAAAECARVGHTGDPSVIRTLERLMAAQASRLAMFASCGWFWEDPTRPEVSQILRFAGHAVRTVDETCGTDLENGLIEELSAVHARPGVTRPALYAAALDTIGQQRLNGRPARSA